MDDYFHNKSESDNTANIEMKIVFVENGFLPGGAQNVLRQFFNMVSVSDIKTSILSLRPPHRSFDESNYSGVVCYPEKRLGKFSEILYAYKYFNSEKPDVLFCTSSNVFWVVYISLFFTKLNTKIFFRYPTTPSLEMKDKNMPKMFGLLLKCTNFILLKSKRVRLIAQTEEIARDIASYYKVDARKIDVIHNPIDTDYILEKSCAESKIIIDKTALNILFLGRVRYAKGLDFLLHALELANGSGLKFVLHVVGDFDVSDPYYKMCIELIDKYKLRDSVVLYGHLENPFAEIKACDLFVLPSRREGLPNVLLECLLFGKKIVSTNCVPVIERILSCNPDYIVEFGDIGSLSSKIINHRALSSPKFGNYKPVQPEEFIRFLKGFQ
ncbi:MAG TPA: hypothetical protein DCS87_14810 [Rheinheimera sp.]|nr:hypothetical protein [Rheinheimera sp.]